MAQTDKKEKAPREYRGIIDEIREQQKKTTDMTLKEKLAYFWYYYKVQTIAVVLLVLFLSAVIHDVTSAKDYNFYGIMLNASNLSGDAMEASFGEYAGLDLETYDCFIDTQSTLSYQNQTQYDLATQQKVIGLIQTDVLDTMVLDSQVFYTFSFNGMLADLTTVFTEEELAKYEGNIYYIDYAMVREAEETEATTEELVQESEARSQATAADIVTEAETHRHPETMEEPVPVGIYLTDSSFAQKTGAYDGMVAIYGFSATSQRIDTARQYLDYLFDESIPFDQMVAVY